MSFLSPWAISVLHATPPAQISLFNISADLHGTLFHQGREEQGGQRVLLRD